MHTLIIFLNYNCIDKEVLSREAVAYRAGQHLKKGDVIIGYITRTQNKRLREIKRVE
jgi:hypothetical protein